MSNNIEKSYTELHKILQLLGDKYIKKIPTEIMELIENNKDDNYEVNINPNIALEEQNLLPDTINFLAMLKLDYWCENEKEKNELLSILRRNEDDYQKELKQKYDYDELFKKPELTKKIQEDKMPVITNKKNFIAGCIEKLKRLFRKSK